MAQSHSGNGVLVNSFCAKSNQSHGGGFLKDAFLGGSSHFREVSLWPTLPNWGGEKGWLRPFPGSLTMG